MKLTELLIATHNISKFEENKVKFSKDLNNVKILSLTDLGITEDYEETGETFEENAMGKAKFYYNIAGIPTIADDSGFVVDALNGEPGVHSRTWPGYTASDEELLQMLMDKMKDVPSDKRTAKFVCVIAYYDGNEELLARGEKYGIVTQEQMCPIKKGIPYSSVFVINGCDKVTSQLSVAEKNAISHRGAAIDELLKKIK